MSNTSLAGHILSLEEAEQILAPYRERLNRCIKHGWDVWKSDYQHKHHILHARARAAIVFDEIAYCAMEEFPTIPGEIKAVRTASTFMLYIGDSITLRFKKIGKNGRCSNVLTRQQVLFRAQIQLNFPSMLDGTLVSAGYVLDDLQQNVIRMSVVCHLDNTVLWEMSLAADNAAMVEFTPPASSAPITPQELQSRFEPKPGLVPEKPIVKIAGEDK
ncbi:MAG TPA: hypothetical protein VGU46_03565 [Acidobacteriaceae bacterium]|nr:hypothetical protein [Acidobacteriaceae bacterium]